MTLRSLFQRIAKLLPPAPDVEHVCEETSAREVNRLLAQGWRLLLVVNVSDGCGGYPCYVMGKPRTNPDQ